MSKIVNYLDKDANPNEGYIYRDVRPLSKKFTSIKFDNVILIDTTTSSTGIIYKTIDDTNIPFIHNFHHPTGQTKKPLGHNLCIGENAGNFTMGSTATQTYHASNNIFIGYQAGKSNTTGYQNYFFGHQSGFNNTTGYQNYFFGYQSGFNNTTGYQNYFFGYQSGFYNTIGVGNHFFGYQSGHSNIDGVYNSFFGYAAGKYNTNGYDNSFFGSSAGKENTTGYNNSFFGNEAGAENETGYENSFFGSYAGEKLGNGDPNLNSTYSVFLGANTKSKQANQTNEIVIGYNAIGEGSNTVRLGNDSITDVITSGVIKSGGYKSSDGSAGITKTIQIKDYSNKTHTLTFKNGILTAHTYA